MEETLYRAYVKILEEELIPAMGCTEPIAVAYAGALARQTLGELPRSVDVQVSANIIKNVKSAVVPHTGGLRGIAAAAAAGIVAGDAGKELEVLSAVTQEQIASMADNHYYIEKAVRDGSTVTEVRPLSREETIDEISRLSGSKNITETTRETTAEMKQLRDDYERTLRE